MPARIIGLVGVQVHLEAARRDAVFAHKSDLKFLDVSRLRQRPLNRARSIWPTCTRKSATTRKSTTGETAATKTAVASAAITAKLGLSLPLCFSNWWPDLKQSSGLRRSIGSTRAAIAIAAAPKTALTTWKSETATREASSWKTATGKASPWETATSTAADFVEFDVQAHKTVGHVGRGIERLGEIEADAFGEVARGDLQRGRAFIVHAARATGRAVAPRADLRIGGDAWACSDGRVVKVDAARRLRVSHAHSERKGQRRERHS